MRRDVDGPGIRNGPKHSGIDSRGGGAQVAVGRDRHGPGIYDMTFSFRRDADRCGSPAVGTDRDAAGVLYISGGAGRDAISLGVYAMRIHVDAAGVENTAVCADRLNAV